MTKRQAQNYARLSRTMLDGLSIARDDFNALLRIERTLHRWAERECNGEVEVDDGGVARAFNHHANYIDPRDPRYWMVVPNRERGALRRLSAIMARYPELGAYHQSDPRGCALYLFRKADMEGKDVDAYYSSRGVAVCY